MIVIRNKGENTPTEISEVAHLIIERQSDGAFRVARNRHGKSGIIYGTPKLRRVIAESLDATKPVKAEK